MLITATALSSVSAARGQTVTNFQYDANGNVTSVQKGAGGQVYSTYDALNRRSAVTDAKGAATRFTYSGMQDLATVTDDNKVVTQYATDGTGHVTKIISPDGGIEDFSYDEEGNLLKSSHSSGRSAAYTYDTENRVLTVQYADGSKTTYSYDEGDNAKGLLTHISDDISASDIRYEYDVFGQVVRETRIHLGSTSVTSYAYDLGGAIIQITYPSGRLVEYARNETGQVTQITTTKSGATTVLADHITYAPFGDVSSFVFGNGERFERSYDSEGKIASFNLHGDVRSLSYDTEANIIGIGSTLQPSLSATLGYDAANRVISQNRPTTSITYRYDGVGNRLSRSVGSSTNTYTYNAGSNRLAKATSLGSFNYDEAGNATSRGAITFAYDVRGRMTAAQTAVGMVQYQVNSLGQRVSKKTPKILTFYHYDLDGKLLSELTGQAYTDYVFLDRLPIAVLK
jgi:YD repeat-containing protein